MYDYADLYQRGLNAPAGAFFEAIIEAIYTLTLRPGDCAVDAGANVGRHTWPMADCVGTEGCVYAFEPIPDLNSRLQAEANRRTFGQARIMPTALGAQAGSATFNWVVHSNGLSGLRERDMSGTDSASITRIEVPVTTLDIALASRPSPVRFVKADLEGGEYDMLRGAQRVMADDKPLIVFENGRQSAATLYNYDKSDWFALFRARGYQVTDLFGRAFTEDQWAASGLPWYTIASPVENPFAPATLDAAITRAKAATGK